MTVFEAWEDEGEVAFSTQDNILDQKKKGLLSNNAKLLHQIEAKSYEEGMIRHHQKMGWEPYKVIKKN